MSSWDYHRIGEDQAYERFRSEPQDKYNQSNSESFNVNIGSTWRSSSRGAQPDCSSFLEPSSDTPYYMTSHVNLDKFLCSVYNYFLGKGFVCLIMAKALNLITLLWVIFLVTFLITSLDYEELFKTYYLPSAIRYTGLNPLLGICLGIFFLFWIYQLCTFLYEFKIYWGMRQFFNKELRITEDDIHTIEWNEVVQKLITVPRLSNTKERLTHLDIANCIMRKQNYLIAMINKETLNVEIPLIPLVSRSVVTKTLEWALSFTIFNYIFNQNGLQHNVITSSTQNSAAGLRKRFRMMGILGLFISPFLFVFLIIYLVFKYGEEVHSRPGSFALREWSPLAKWKFREFNELPHIFHRRLNLSKPLAEKYVSSFNVDILIILARFVSFVIGSVVVVFIIFGLVHEDMILKLNISHEISVFWLLGVSTTILAICRSFIPDPSLQSEPSKLMQDIVQHTHYLPNRWRSATHTKRVLNEFTSLFQYKVFVLFTELISVLLTPLILIFSLPQSSENIILFFREYTVQVNGVGDVCKYAIFPLDEHGSKTYGAQSNSSKRQRTKQGKMEKSFLNFKANNPEWQPGEEGEKYLANVSAAMGSTINHSSFNFRDVLNSSVKSDPANPNHLSWSLGESYMSDSGIIDSSLSLSDSMDNLRKFHKSLYTRSVSRSNINNHQHTS